MIKSLYDTDCTVWSPQGKLLQVTYAMEAVKQGSVCLGLMSKDHAVIRCHQVLCSLKRAPFQLAQFYDKIFKIQQNLGMVMAGLIPDARVLCKYMRNQCTNYKYAFGTYHPINRLIMKIAESFYSLTESQHKTKVVGKRPYGVGLLIAGYDVTFPQKQDGPHIFQTCPSGNFFEFQAYAIGARCQSARTYFQNFMEKIKASDLQLLIKHGLTALKKCLQEDDQFSQMSIEVGVVGKDTQFHSLTTGELKKHIEQLASFKPQDQMQLG